MRPYLKNNHYKKRLVEWLKVKALSSNPSTGKKKKRRTERKTKRKIILGSRKELQASRRDTGEVLQEKTKS
jgi:hypothetical protein